MDQNKIDLVRLLIGDVPSSPFYPLFTDEQIDSLLELTNGDVMKAARYAAISAQFQLAGWSTSYLAGLKYLTDAAMGEIPNGMMPWAAGLSKAEACAMARNPDLIKSNLLNIYQCDNPCNRNPYTTEWSCGC